MKYGRFDIIVFKSPFICIPGKFVKSFTKSEEKINSLLNEEYNYFILLYRIEEKVLTRIKYHNDFYHFKQLKQYEKLKPFSEKYIEQVILNNVAFPFVKKNFFIGIIASGAI